MQLQRQIDNLIAKRASEWHQILESASELQRMEFVTWLRQSPLHVKEYLETAYTDQILKHVDAEGEFDVDALLKTIAPEVVPFSGSSQTPGRNGRRVIGWKSALAAGFAICVVFATLIYTHF